MRNKVMWAIRDARGLSHLEKVFLYTVESRGTMTTKQVNAAEDMGMSRATYYRVRDSLIERQLIKVSRKMDAPTEYTVNEVSLSETVVSHTETVSEDKVSHTETVVSQSDNTKKNTKKNTTTKKNSKKNNGASAPVDSSLIKEEVIPSSLTSNPSSFEEIVSPLLNETGFSLKNPTPSDAATPSPYESRSAADWNAIRKQRPLTRDEKDFINERSSRYMAEKRAKEAAEEVVETW